MKKQLQQYKIELLGISRKTFDTTEETKSKESMNFIKSNDRLFTYSSENILGNKSKDNEFLESNEEIPQFIDLESSKTINMIKNTLDIAFDVIIGKKYFNNFFLENCIQDWDLVKINCSNKKFTSDIDSLRKI